MFTGCACVYARALIIHIDVFPRWRLEITYVRTCAIESNVYVGRRQAAWECQRENNPSNAEKHFKDQDVGMLRLRFLLL